MSATVFASTTYFVYPAASRTIRGLCVDPQLKVLYEAIYPKFRERSELSAYREALKDHLRDQAGGSELKLPRYMQAVFTMLDLLELELFGLDL